VLTSNGTTASWSTPSTGTGTKYFLTTCASDGTQYTVVNSTALSGYGACELYVHIQASGFPNVHFSITSRPGYYSFTGTTNTASGVIYSNGEVAANTWSGPYGYAISIMVDASGYLYIKSTDTRYTYSVVAIVY